MKKKLLSLALALVLCLSLAVPAFAAEEDKADAAVSGEEKKEESKTPAEGEEKKDEEKTPAEDEEKKDESKAPAEGEDKKDESKAPAEGEDKKDESKAPAEGEDKKDESKAPAEGEEKKDESKAPAEGEDKKDEKPAEAPAPKFTDVAADSPFAKAIDWAVAEGITTGKTETTFGPKDTCTISHIITFLWRANGKPGAAEGVKDRDAAAKWAVEQKLIGEDQDVSAPCTRVMAVGFMWGVAGKPESKTELSFTDVDKEADYAGAVAWAVENKVTAGTSETTFSPTDTCTRGQIVTFLFRADQAAAPAEGEAPAETEAPAEASK